jgi:type IV pilus assembly protein PilW
MVAMVIGAIVIAGALQLYARGRAVYRVNERIARLQEQGRFALSVLEPDIELAGYYGFTNSPDIVRFVRGANPEAPLATAAGMRQFPLHAGELLPQPVAGLPAGAHVCGVNFAIDVTMPLQGSNDVFALGRGRAAGCDAYQGRPQGGADTLTIRRASTQVSAPEVGRIQVYASRFTSRTSQLMFADGNAPGILDSDHRVQNLVVRSYYVARDSVGQRNFPALRVKSLTRSGAAVVFDEDEIMPGIEDLQVQFAIDTANPASGQATRYVNPDFGDLPRALVVAARVWLRIRADEPETGFVDAQTYEYANVVYTPAGPERGFRRVVMSRTVALRNARQM